MATPFRSKLVKAQYLPPLWHHSFGAFGWCWCGVIWCILLPLLTIIAGCMGVNAHIAISQMWKEPAILWFIIVANKGQKKTAALRLLKKPLQEIEEKEAEKWFANHGNEQNESPPQLSIDSFSFEELHNVMRTNGSQILGLFHEMSTHVRSAWFIQAVWFRYGPQDAHNVEWWQFMIKKLSKLHSFNE